MLCRDYAYSIRKNNIKNNWPFSQKSLQLLSTHGVTDPLPPFQRFSTVTNQFETTANSSSSGNQIVSYAHQGRDLAKLGLTRTLAETSKGVCSQSRIVKNGLCPSAGVSKSEVEIVVASTSTKSNHYSNKCGRGMVKSKEDSCGGLLTTSESIMASKTCPICKTFSSASNTTLNAHIDQCLSVDSELPPVVSSKPNKPRSKPRVKVKTMVEIYATAKECTVEDLDRRNGTKWASILSYTNQAVADKSEVSKKRKVSPVGVGPVYIDAKGQKLRILSEFSEKKSCTTPLRKQHDDGSDENKCLSQGSKGNNNCLRKNRRGRKPHKYVVKLTNHKANAPEIPEFQRRNSGEGSSMGPRRIYNQRMLAERGLVSKKLNEKEQKRYRLRDQPSEDDDDTQSEGDPYVLRGTSLSARDSSSLNKQNLRSKVARKNKTFVSKRAQSHSFRVRMSEKEEESLVKSPRVKKTFASIQKSKFPPEKNFCSDAVEVSDASPRATIMRKLSPPPSFVPHAWRRLSMPVEQKKARLDFSEDEDEEEETWKWESEMSQERELSEDDYVSGDNGEHNEVLLKSNPSFSGYDDYNDDDEESSEEEEEEEDDNKRAHVLDKTDDISADFDQSESTPSNEVIPSERAMYYSEDVGDMIDGQTCKEGVRFESQVGQGSLFVEVDTIPIPGPPGSFLPSPRDMGFDETLGNSSVITSQIQSSMDQLDRNSSESPVSAVSNFARLNFHPEIYSSIQETFSPDIHVFPYSTTPMSFCVPSLHVTTSEADPITIDKTTTPSRFGNNDQKSCCCQRKERIYEGITNLNHQASHLLQRRAASSSSSSMAIDLTKSPTCLDPNHPFDQSPYKIQQGLDKLSRRTNLNAPVPPSPSTPILRLMGKDLMVMNQGEADEEADLMVNTGLYLTNNNESTHQPQAQGQPHASASAFRNNFDYPRYFSPS